MSASLRHRRDAHTVLLRMARDEARAERIRGLKARWDKAVTWAEIAAAVGVAERSALAWQQTGEISRPNAVKLARFFQEKGEPIDDDYVWSGLRPDTPDLMRHLNGERSQLDRIEKMLQSVTPAATKALRDDPRDARELAAMHAKLDDLQEAVDRIEGYLREQASAAVRERVKRAARQQSKRRDTRRADPAAEDG